MSSNPNRALPAFAVPEATQSSDSPASTLTKCRAPHARPRHLELLPSAPVARTDPHTIVMHGESRVDEYYWLRHLSDPDTLAYLQAENRYTQAVMRHTEELQEQLYQELRGRIKETDLSVPERIDDWLYYARTEAGGQYPIYCRCPVAADSAEIVLLDQNPLAVGHSYYRLGAFEVSPDHRFLAYSIDTCGSESYTLYLKDLCTGELLTDTLTNTAPALAWANDSRTFFYLTLDQARRPCRLLRHRLGADPAEDVLIHDETDEAFFLDVGRTRSRQFILLDINSHSTSEVRFISADRPEDPFRVLEPRRAGVEYNVSHHADRFFITTNDEAPNFRLVSAPVDDPSRANWTPVLPHRSAVKLDLTDAFRDHLVIYQRVGGLRQIRILDLNGDGDHLVPFPEPVYSAHAHDNPEFDTSVLRFSYTSMVTPSSVVDYDMAARSWTVRKQTEVLGGYDQSCYRSERVFAQAPDGVSVPVSLVYRLPLELDGSRPLLLNGYGAYGISYEPGFSSHALSLLDRGFVVAIAHVRGGEEMGRAWYEEGKLLQKRNSFTDFIAAAEHLISAGYTSREGLVISGGSAGGLLMGAVTNLRPDLFRAVVMEVPFVDVVNTMLDASLPLTVIEYDEWGNPAEREFYRYIRSYSPYDNIEAKDYPEILITAGLNDPRVAYWEPAKWTARLRARKTDQNRLLLRTNMGAGHGGASGRYDHLREVAFKWAFVLDVLGMA
jgi:oligopeptidase B